jgi:hypothetical protein
MTTKSALARLERGEGLSKDTKIRKGRNDDGAIKEEL